MKPLTNDESEMVENDNYISTDELRVYESLDNIGGLVKFFKQDELIEIKQKCAYQIAEKKFNSKKYDTALSYYEEANDYLDSFEKQIYCKYMIAYEEFGLHGSGIALDSSKKYFDLINEISKTEQGHELVVSYIKEVITADYPSTDFEELLYQCLDQDIRQNVLAEVDAYKESLRLAKEREEAEARKAYDDLWRERLNGTWYYESKYDNSELIDIIFYDYNIVFFYNDGKLAAYARVLSDDKGDISDTLRYVYYEYALPKNELDGNIVNYHYNESGFLESYARCGYHAFIKCFKKDIKEFASDNDALLKVEEYIANKKYYEALTILAEYQDSPGAEELIQRCISDQGIVSEE